jgi:hypothetical protein
MIRYAWEFGALIMICAVCQIHANRFARNKPTGPWFHFFWAIAYAAPCAVISWLDGSWMLAVALAMERFVSYNLILNRIRNKPPLYLHAGDTGSLWDQLELWWKGAYPYFLCAGVIIFITIQLFLRGRFLKGIPENVGCRGRICQ